MGSYGTYVVFLSKKWTVFAVTVCVCLVLLVACEKQQSPDEMKASLEKMAEQYWIKRLMDFDYKFTYDMELAKDSMPFSEYLERVKNAGKIKILSIKTKKVNIENEKGLVELTAKFRVPGVSKDMEMPLKDIWVYKSNQWKHKLIKK